MQVAISSCLRRFAGIRHLGSANYLQYSPLLTCDLCHHSAYKGIWGGLFWGDRGCSCSTYDRQSIEDRGVGENTPQLE